MKSAKNTRIKPLAKVYRRAAELIQTGEENYTCFAISKAVNETYSKRSWLRRNEIHSMYGAQYIGMFGRCWHAEAALSSIDSYRAAEAVEKEKDDRCPIHPFWNRSRDEVEDSPETQDYRVTALLLMAEIVESPNI